MHKQHYAMQVNNDHNTENDTLKLRLGLTNPTGTYPKSKQIVMVLGNTHVEASGQLASLGLYWKKIMQYFTHV